MGQRKSCRRMCPALAAMMMVSLAFAQTPRERWVAPESGRIAAVDAVEVSRERFNALYAGALAKSPASAQSLESILQLKRAIASRLIDEQLVASEGRRRGISISDAEVGAAVADLHRGLRPSSWRSYLTGIPGGIDEIRLSTRARLLRERFLGSVAAPDPADARRYYDLHRDLYDREASAIVRDLAFAAPRQSPEGTAAARTLAETALAQAHKYGFLAAARRWSATAQAREAVPATDPAIVGALSALAPGDVSGVIETADGFHVVQLVARRPAVHQSFNDARAEIARLLMSQRRARAEAELNARLRSEHQVENDLEARYAFIVQLPRAETGLLPGVARGQGLLGPQR